MGVGWRAILLAGVLVLLVGSARAAALGGVAVRTPQAAIEELNAERAANGIPGVIVEERAWSERCLAHTRWMERNRAVQHDEQPGTPLYSTDGSWAAARSVLAGGLPWTTRRTPWALAPMHLAQLLAPQLRRMGVAIFRGYACATTFPGYARRGPAPTNVVYAYPSSGEPVPRRERADEVPFTPQRFVGIADRQATGPYLIVFADGPWLAFRPPSIRTATLAGPSGAVEVRYVDWSSPDVGRYLPRGAGVVIPVRPLEPHARYVASVTLADRGARVMRTWSFVTR